MAPRADADLGTLLAVFAHPDDETYLCAGLMAAAAEAGRRVVCVTATRGEAGFADDDPRTREQRIEIRTAELGASLDVLGVTEHHWLDHPDGGCAEVEDRDAVAPIVDIIEDVVPDTILTFDVDGGTGHRDHIAVSRWTTLAARTAAVDATLLFSTQTPEWNQRFLADLLVEQIMMDPDMPLPATEPDQLHLWYRLDDPAVERKVSALRCQSSQVDGLYRQIGAASFREMVRDECFRAATPADWAG